MLKIWIFSIIFSEYDIFKKVEMTSRIIILQQNISDFLE